MARAFTLEEIKAACKVQRIAYARISKRVHNSAELGGAFFVVHVAPHHIVYFIDRDARITRFAFCKSGEQAHDVCDKQCIPWREAWSMQ